jgi:hypothetical protein
MLAAATLLCLELLSWASSEELREAVRAGNR